MGDVAFCRTLTPGITGQDVVAHKRAISRADPAAYRWAKFTPFYGPLFEKAVAAFQTRKGIHKDPRGTIGQATHDMLEKEKNANGDPVFDRLAVEQAAAFCADYREHSVRDAIVAAGFYWYGQRAKIVYSHQRPFQQGKPPWAPDQWDCSAFVTVCHFAGGAPNPNGRSWDGAGYTGTLMSRGERVAAVGELEPGDLVFYGSSPGAPGFNRGDPTHVALYVGMHDGVPMVLSMGQAPLGFYRVDYRADLNHYRKYDVTPDQ